MSFTAIYAKTVNAVVALARFQPTDPNTGFPAVDQLNRPLLGDIVHDPIAGAALNAVSQSLQQLLAVASATGNFVVNRNTISTALVVPTGSNAALIGPITIEPGASITIPATSFLKVL